MKFTLLVLALISGSLLFAQDIPPAVDQAFKKQFPVVTEATWKDTDGSTYIVAFYETEVYKIATYSPDGTWISSKTYLYDTQLPENVRNAVSSKFPNGIMTEINQMEEGKNFFYDIYVENNEDYWYLKLDKSGNITSTEKILDDY